jgi:hypothetical protein
MPSSNEALDSSNPLPRPTWTRVAYIQLMQFLSQLCNSLILLTYLSRVPYLPEDVEEDDQDEPDEGTNTRPTHWTAATESTSSFDDYDGSIGGASSTGHYYETISSSSSSAYYTSTSPAPPSIADFNSQDTPLEFADILPANRRSYDKMEPPKKDGSFVLV